MNRALMQNIAIVILLSMSLILLSIRFELLITPKDSGTVAVENTASLKQSVRPTSIELRAGQENATKILDKSGLYYLEIAKVLEKSFETALSTKEILKNEYGEKKEKKVIQLNFEPAIDQRLLYGSLFLKDGSIGEFGKIREILLPQSYDTSVFIRTAEDKYFEIKNTAINTVASLDNFGNISYSKYYSIADRFPELTDNDVLISDDARLSSYVTESMFKDVDAETVIKEILGAKYDFSNQISEIDGSVLVTYDYGREIVKISKEGKVFYYNKDAQVNKTRTSVSGAVAKALAMVNGISQGKAVFIVDEIKDYKEGSNSGYEIKISRKIDGIRLSFKDDVSSITVIVMNGKIYSLEGIFRNLKTEIKNDISLGENAVLLMLEQNYDYIRAVEYFRNTSDLFNKIQSVEYAYVYTKDYNVEACYRMHIGNTVFFFRLEDAKVVI